MRYLQLRIGTSAADGMKDITMKHCYEADKRSSQELDIETERVYKGELAPQIVARKSSFNSIINLHRSITLHRSTIYEPQ